MFMGLYTPSRKTKYKKFDNENIILKIIMQAVILHALKIQSLLALIPNWEGSICRV